MANNDEDHILAKIAGRRGWIERRIKELQAEDAELARAEKTLVKLAEADRT